MIIVTINILNQQWPTQQRIWQGKRSSQKWIFLYIQNLGFKLSIEKCQFGIPKSRFLGHVISAAGISPNKSNVEKFIENARMPKTMKQVLFGFMQYFQKLIPNLVHKLHPFSNCYEKKLNLTIQLTIKNPWLS